MTCRGVDSSSRECVRFAARRAGGSVSVVMSARDADMPALAAELPRLPVGRLAPADAIRLLIAVAPDLARPVAAAVADAAAGNPLALIELAGTLEPAQRSGLTPLPVPLSPGPRLGDAYRRRIAGLSDDERRALLIAAAYGGAEVRTIGSACAAIGGDISGLAAAEAVGLVRMTDGQVTFAHPLVRGAVYHGCASAERRSAHAALAQVLHGEQRAWHLGAATVGPDEQVAVELEAAGCAAMARRGAGPASVAFERAARLSPDTAAYARCTLAAGEAAAAAALADRALALLAEAANAAPDDAVRASAQHLRALTLLRTSLPPALETLEREGLRVAARDPI